MAKRNVNAPPPPYTWPELPAAQSELDAKKLAAWWQLLKKNNTNSIFVMHNDKIVFERYAKGYDRHKPHYTASMAKALTGGMSLLFAIHDGLIKFEDPAWKYVPQWKNDPQKSLWHILQPTPLGLPIHQSQGLIILQSPDGKVDFGNAIPCPTIHSPFPATTSPSFLNPAQNTNTAIRALLCSPIVSPKHYKKVHTKTSAHS